MRKECKFILFVFCFDISSWASLDTYSRSNEPSVDLTTLKVDDKTSQLKRQIRMKNEGDLTEEREIKIAIINKNGKDAEVLIHYIGFKFVSEFYVLMK